MVIKLEDTEARDLSDNTMSSNNIDDGLVSVSNQSTKSSQGRKLRQVLQKKQLDVLLQTYSSFIEETEESPIKQAATTDFTLIARKSSIEGNPTFTNMALSCDQCKSHPSRGQGVRLSRQ